MFFNSKYFSIFFLAIMACCSYSELVSGDCGSSVDNPTNVKCVTSRECTKEVFSHLVFYKVSDDSAVDTEWKLLLARAGNVQKSTYHETHFSDISQTIPPATTRK